MSKRQLSLIGLTLFLFVVAILFDLYTRKFSNLNKYAVEISEHLQETEKKIAAVFEDKDFHINRLSNKYANNAKGQVDFKKISQLSVEPFTICIYKTDSLIFWSNTSSLPEAAQINGVAAERQTSFVKLVNGYYAFYKQTFRDNTNGEYNVIALSPIKYDYALESDYLNNRFAAGENIPKSIILQEAGTENPIIGRGNKKLCYLAADGPLRDKRQIRNSFILYLLAFLSLATVFNGLAKRIGQPDKPWLGALFLIVSVFGLRLLSINFEWTEVFYNMELFSKNFSTPISRSLGDLLINIFLLLWVMLFFHRQYPVSEVKHNAFVARFGLSSLYYFSILIGIFILTLVFKSLVFNTKIVLDYDNVFNLDFYSILSIIGVILLLIALFLFSHRMVKSIAQLGLTRYQRLASLGLSALVVLPVYIFGDIMISPFYILLIALGFSWMFDLFVDYNSSNFGWLVIWLLILAAFPSIILFRYNAFEDRLTRLSYAKELSILRDNVAENSLLDLREKISGDQKVSDEVTKPYYFNFKKDVIQKEIDRLYSNNDYLYYNYSYDIYSYNKDAQHAIEKQEKEYEELSKKMSISPPTIDDQLKFWTNGTDKFSYILKIDDLSKNELNPITLFIEFNRKRREQSKVYTELLVDRPYKNLENIHNFDYAIYKSGKLLDSEGGEFSQSLNLSNIPPTGEHLEMTTSKKSNIVYHAENGNIVIIGKDKENFIKAISLFSYIFGLLMILICCFAVFNTIFKLYPDVLSFPVASKRTLKYRIQSWVITLILISFITIGGVSVWFFSFTSEEYHENRLVRKTSSILKDAQHELEMLDSTLHSIDVTRRLVKPISMIHRMDINLYDTNGRLFESSEVDIYNKGIINKQMGAVAYFALDKQKKSKFVDIEKIGDLTYKSAYVPLKGLDENNKFTTIAYMGLPYYSEQSSLRSDVTVFMSTLLNVYVFLLLIAGAIAIFTANSITKPLKVLEEKLKQFKLGTRNEPIEWKSQDELGVLINEYNKLIVKLEESANKLEQTAQEGAWREMAKQVAHEIKNPLTPMKLSIQYLNHAYKSNPADIEGLLQRVCNTMIEQIDNLSQIASEFSNFAKMPRAENTRMEINDLLQNVFQLYSNEREDVNLDIFLPREQYFVYADKNHLMRVLNNVIKNAIQAVPMDREGQIDVSLYKKENFIVVKVKDNGTGIPEDKRDKVFVPNFTTKNSGTGLGLAISKNIIESINGSIYFDTETGVGTDFYIELPIIDVKELEAIS